MLKRPLFQQILKLRSLATSPTNTVDKQEFQHFDKLAAQWCDEFGVLKPLHAMNKLRIPLIRDGLVSCGILSHKKANDILPLEGLSILDVGCGGGILSENLARLGGNITGVDASPEVIEVAQSQAKINNLKIKYITSSVEEHASAHAEKYDAIVASEVIEHVTEKELFLEGCVKCLKPDGSIFVTTMNKTFLASFLGIFMAENVFGIIPEGTHQYEKFLEPAKLQTMLQDNNCRTVLIHGMFYNLVTNNWYWCANTSISYALHAVKLKS